MSAVPEVERALPEELDRLAELVAAAFLDLAPSVWLLPDPRARWRIFPDYFRLYLELGLSAGTVQVNATRTAVAIWLPVSPAGPPELPGYEQRLDQITGEHAERFHQFDAALDKHHRRVPHEWLAILAVDPTSRAVVWAAECCAPTTACWTGTAPRPTWRPPTSSASICMCGTATPSSQAPRSGCLTAVRRCGRCGARRSRPQWTPKPTGTRGSPPHGVRDGGGGMDGMMPEPPVHHEWCAPELCERYPGPTHVGHPVVLDDESMVMFLLMEPDELPHLVIEAGDEVAVKVPLHHLRGFLLGVARVTGSVDWQPETQDGYTKQLVAAYREGQ